MTTNPLRAARGTTATLGTRALKEGELAYNTDTEELHVGDGTTLGGRPVSSEVDGDDIDVTATGGSVARSLADWFQGYARGSEAPDSDGHFTDKGGVLLHRFRDRVFIGDFNDDDGSTTGASSQTWIPDESLGDWIPRGSTLGVHSTIGGIGVHGGSRQSDRYKVDGSTVTVWAAGQSISAAGVYRGYQGKVYVSTGAGTTNSTPPTHTSGTVSDGTVSWTFVDYAWGAPIGLQGAFIYDGLNDGQGGWAAHLLAVRKASGGTTYGIEIDLLNRGTDITNSPYSISPAGSTIGIWLAAGYDVLASVNPATCAILIGQSDSTWNSGIVFESDGITTGGYAMKLAAVESHSIGWFNASGQQVALMRSDATANDERTQLLFGNRKIELYAAGGVMATFQSGASAGVAADEHVNLTAYAAGTGYARVSPHGTAANLDLLLNGKGTGNPKTDGRFFQKTSKSTPYLLYALTDEITHAGSTSTSETAIVTTQVPAGDIGPNGFLRVRARGTCSTSSANNKQIRLRLGGIGGTNFGSVAHTTNLVWDAEWIIKNQNSQSEQHGFLRGNRGTDAVMTVVTGVDGTIDTSANQDLVFSFQVANSGESMTLESYAVEVIYGA